MYEKVDLKPSESKLFNLHSPLSIRISDKSTLTVYELRLENSLYKVKEFIKAISLLEFIDSVTSFTLLFVAWHRFFSTWLLFLTPFVGKG